jgi:hypothetical protein
MMAGTLIRAAVVPIPVLLLMAYSVLRFLRQRVVGSVLEAFGAACLTLVVLTHVAEGLNVFPRMRWGQPDSVGHYVDLCSAVLGLTLTPVGVP